MKFLVAVLGACLVLASARPSHKRDFGMDDAYQLGENEDALKTLLKDASTDDIKQGARELTNDIESANKDIEDLLGAGDVVDDDFNVNPKFVEIGAKYAQDFENAQEDLNKLPPLPPREDLHFLDQCMREAEKVNWDDKTLKDFVNDVVKHGLTCMHSGMKILLEAADLDGVKDEDLTVVEIGSRLSKAKQVMIEMGHLLKFMMGLERELMKGEKSFNEIMDFSGKDGTKPPMPQGTDAPPPNNRELLKNLLRELSHATRGRQGGKQRGGKGQKSGDDKSDDKNGGFSGQDDDRDGTRPPRPEGSRSPRPEGSRPPKPEGTKPAGPKPSGAPRPEDKRDFLVSLLRELSAFTRGRGRKGGKGQGGGDSKPDDKDGGFSGQDDDRDGTRPPRPEGSRPPRPEGSRPPKPDGTRPPKPEGTKPAGPRPSGPPAPEDKRDLLVSLLRDLTEFTRGRGKGGKGDGDRGQGDENDDKRPQRLEGSRLPRPDGSRPPRPEGSRPPRPEGSRPPRPEGSRPPRPEGSRPPRPDGTRPPRGDKEDGASGFLDMIDEAFEKMKRNLFRSS